jgi:hypothetical protein
MDKDSMSQGDINGSISTSIRLVGSLFINITYKENVCPVFAKKEMCNSHPEKLHKGIALPTS